MTVDSSIPEPPAVPDIRELTARHDETLRSVVAQLNDVSARLEAIEAQMDVAQPPERPASPATPTWRTKTGRQTGWQPARR